MSSAGSAAASAASFARPAFKPVLVDRISPRDIDISAIRLGGGGFAAVFRAVYKGSPAAVKIAVEPTESEEHLTAFRDELLTLERVNGHPNIVRTLAADPRPPRPFVVMELCRESLYDALHGPGAAKFASVPVRARLAMAADIASALDFLHSLRPSAIIFRDVKSQNVLFTASGKLVLADFGLVSCKTPDAGTPAYLAPELWSCKPFGRAADIFAFAILLHELLTGAIPWAGLRPTDIRDAVVGRGERPPLDALPERTPAAVRDLLSRAWAADPAARPTASEIVVALTAAAAAAAAEPAGSGGAGRAGAAGASTGAGARSSGGAGIGSGSSGGGGPVDSLGAALAGHAFGGSGRPAPGRR